MDSKGLDRDHASADSLTRLGAAGLAGWVLLLLVGLALLASFWVVVPAGSRGVWLHFGQVQPHPLGEGVHFMVPLVDRVENLTVRVQKQEIPTEASSEDLQDVFADVAVNWHIPADQVDRVFQRIGRETAVVDRVLNPAIEETIKAVMAHYRAEAVITQRDQVKAEVDQALRDRLGPYDLAVDDVALTTIHFSQQFREAVEAKQIAEQEAKRAEFVARRAIREAEIEINLARGKAEAHRLLQSTLTTEVLRYQALQKWNGHLPLILGTDPSSVIDLKDLMPAANPPPSEITSGG